jgi:protein gp37
MADLFGEWVPDDEIESVFDVARRGNPHTFIFLTKNPRRMKESIDQYVREENFKEKKDWLDFTSRCWFGVSVTGPEIESKIELLNQICGIQRFVSFEPLLQNPGGINLSKIKQVILGAQTNPMILPPDGAITNIVREAAQCGAKSFFKNSLNGVPFVGESTFINNKELAWPLNKIGAVKV